MGYKVFISYSTSDLPTAEAMRSWIGAAGAEPFLAECSVAPGKPLAADILAAIRGCDLFVLLWSQSAKASEWVPLEVGAATGAGKTIMPVVLHQGLELPGFLKELKYLPLYSDPNSAAQWLHRHLVERVRDKQLGTAVAVGIVGVVMAALFGGQKGGGS